jgi:hypothetical protein
MAKRIRLGFIGANIRATWAAQSHFPALLASPDVELMAVCNTRRETAEAARATPPHLLGHACLRLLIPRSGRGTRRSELIENASYSGS